jgi:NAD(P) transhydrogenase
MKKYDLVVIGSGPAGEKGAAQAAYFGKKVAVVERGEWIGGVCVNTGTIPSKCLREAALYYSGLLRRGLFGIDYSLRAGLTVQDWMHRKDVVVELERKKVKENLILHRIDFIRGTACFEDAHTLAVQKPEGETERIYGDIILIATGSRPSRPPGIPFDTECVFDSDTILHMDRIPKSMIVVGGGVIGCEYASIFTALGVKVTLVDGRERPLSFLDEEISNCLAERLTAWGLQLVAKARPASTERRDSAVRLTLASGQVLEAETALFSTGRAAVVDGLGLERPGVEMSPYGLVKVNEAFQTSVPNIYAAGDVIGFPALASTSMEQGRVAVCHAFKITYKQRVPEMLPLGIYTIPEISAVGETEESCEKKGIAYEVGRAHYSNNARGMIIGDTGGMLKLVFRRDDRRLLGVHIIGEGATDLVHIGMMAMEFGGRLDNLIDSVFNYPTLSETYKAAAYDGLGNLAGYKVKEG